jgi:hypothetical protein
LLGFSFVSIRIADRFARVEGRGNSLPGRHQLLEIEVRVSSFWGSGGTNLQASDAFHAEFGMGWRRQQTTSVSVTISGAWCVDMGGQISCWMLVTATAQ